MTCLGFIWHYFNVKLHIFFSVCLLLELQSVSIHQFVQIPNTSVTIVADTSSPLITEMDGKPISGRGCRPCFNCFLLNVQYPNEINQ